MTKRFNPEVVFIGRTHIQTKPTEDEYGEFVRYSDYEKAVIGLEEALRDLDMDAPKTARYTLRSVLRSLGEEI